MTWRFRFTFLVFFLCFFLIIIRLFYWQVVRAEELYNLGQAQYGKHLLLKSNRGGIHTSDGYELVTNKISYLLFANPKEIQNKEKIIPLIASSLQIDTASVSSVLSLNRLWVPIQGGLTPSKKDEIEKLQIKGLGFEEQFIRFYPEASLAAQLVGFVGKNELGEDKGYFGLEGYFDRQLKGRFRSILEIQDAFGKPVVAHMQESPKGQNGRTLVTSIDRTIQFLVELKLKKALEKYQASAGMVVVMAPKTGQILAMAALPNFDPRSFNEFPEELYKNPLISSVYEPGSTFKTLIMASGIDAKVVKPQTQCPICNEPVKIGEYEIKTWNNTYYKNTTMTEVIQHSDNTGMVFVAQSLGVKNMISYLNRFGIGETTGVDLQGEVTSYLRPEEEWRSIDLATSSFGQGISVTPLSLLTAFSSIANKGIRMKPYVVARIVTPEGQIIDIKPQKVNEPISETTAKIMTELLVNAVEKGEAKFYKPKGYRIAGKTGTAQIPIQGHYDPNKTIASFIGFAPADNPRFSMLVIFDRPTTSIYGSETAAPVFMDIAKDILSYYGIPVE